MSTSYYMYTEVNIDGKWTCINNRIIDVERNEELMSETYYSGSRSYFGETADKIRDIGTLLKYDDLSDDVKSIFPSYKENPEYFRGFAVYDNEMEACFPEDRMLKEFRGYVKKDILFSFQTGELDDIYEYLSADEYLALPDEKKSFYQFYEWNSESGWYKYFLEILEHFYWQKYEWGLVNFRTENKYKFRLVLIIC
ncbi:MAG: hypothetical protein IKB93_02935 [Clostridia bacterium]|nr:hypothetical protein [Clostridia bacterium]